MMRHVHSEPQLASSKSEYGSVPHRNAELNLSHDQMFNIDMDVDMDKTMRTDEGDGESNHQQTNDEHSEAKSHDDGEDGPLLDEAEAKYKHYGDGENGEDENRTLLEPPLMTKLSISALVSTAFSYGCIMSTLFLLTLPIECQRIETESTKYHMHSYTIHKSMALGGFAAIAGVTQLVTPIVGMLSDHYDPMTMIPKKHVKAAKRLGRRLPYLLLGSFMAVVGAAGQFYASNPIHRNQVLEVLDPTGNNMNIPLDVNVDSMGVGVGVGSSLTSISPKTVILGGAWMEYTIFYSICMIGLNVVYTVMIALIPDLVPNSQTGVANGSLALMIVIGSLFGFGMYYVVLEGDILNMYKMYGVVAFTTGFISFVSVCNRERILQQVDVDSSSTGASIRRKSVKVEDVSDDKEKNQTQAFQANFRLFTQSERTAAATHQADIGLFAPTETQALIESPGLMRQPHPRQRLSHEDSFSILDIPSILVGLFYEPIRYKSQSELFAAYWIDITEHRDFFIVTISRFFYYMGVSSQTFFLYYIHDVLTETEDTANPENAVAVLAIIGQIAGAITCYPIGIISDQYFGGRRKPFVFFSCFCLSLGYISLLYCTSFRQMMWVSTFSGAANGMYLTMDTSLAVDTLENNASDDNDEDEGSADHDDELRGIVLVNKISSSSKENNVNDHDGAAQLLGVWGVCGFVGSASGPLIGGMVLLLAGRNNLEPSQFYSMKGYEGLFLLSAFYFFCSAISLAFVRKEGV